MMKRWMAILLCAALLCGAAVAEAVDVTGKWYLLVIEQQEKSVNPADMGLEMNIELNEDGTGTTFMTGGDVLEATWTLADGVLEVTANECPIAFDIMEDGTLVNVDENGLRMVMSREAPTPSFIPAADAVAESLSQFDGEWMTKKVNVYGVYADFEDLSSMGLTDGSVSIHDGIVTKLGEEEAQTGELVDGQMIVASGVENDEDNLFGTSITLLEDGSIKMVYLGMIFYCDRVQ